MNDEEKAMEEYAKAGVDLPELKEQSVKEEAPEQEPKPEETKVEEHTVPLKENTEPERKRSIYDEYKEKKAELKSERELRERAEQERDEFKRLLENREDAQTPQERQEAQDELEAFAREINADPQTIRKMRDLFLKDLKPQTDESLANSLAEWKTWRAQNEKLIENQLFDTEFQKIVPSLKSILPNITDAEMAEVKKELDRVAHTKEYHDKDLEYVAWKHKDTLSALVSPKKKGIESKGRADTQEQSFTFDPEADISRLSPKEREAWEQEYQKLTSSKELATDSDGRKIFI